MATCDAEVWVLVNADGDFAVGVDAEAVRSTYESDIGSLDECDGFRLVKVILQIPLPAIIELTGMVNDLGAPSGLTAPVE